MGAFAGPAGWVQAGLAPGCKNWQGCEVNPGLAAHRPGFGASGQLLTLTASGHLSDRERRGRGCIPATRFKNPVDLDDIKSDPGHQFFMPITRAPAFPGVCPHAGDLAPRGRDTGNPSSNPAAIWHAGTMAPGNPQCPSMAQIKFAAGERGRGRGRGQGRAHNSPGAAFPARA